MPPELRQPTNFDQAYPGRFLKAGNLDGKKVTLTIESVFHEKLEGDKGVELKVIMKFVGREMQLVVAKTNALCVREMFGPILKDWVGKRITLFESVVENPGALNGKPCIRVWGSPDLPADTTIQIKLPKKKPTPMVMHKTVLNTPTQQEQK